MITVCSCQFLDSISHNPPFQSHAHSTPITNCHTHLQIITWTIKDSHTHTTSLRSLVNPCCNSERLFPVCLFVSDPVCYPLSTRCCLPLILAWYTVLRVFSACPDYCLYPDYDSACPRCSCLPLL